MGEGLVPRTATGAPRRDRGPEPARGGGGLDARAVAEAAGRLSVAGGRAGHPDGPRGVAAVSGVNEREDDKKIRGALQDGLAVVGMGCVFPRAGGIDAFWSNIR